MELLDRYLQAVSRHLTGKRQQDILAELRANLEAQLEDKEAELGRPLTQAEAEAWLKQLGAPMQMAARYRRVQYLIGPGVFPTYWYVLRLALTWAFVIYMVVNAVLVATQTPDASAVAVAVFRLPGVLMTVAAWVTLIFAAVEFYSARHPEKCPEFAGNGASWSPASLPPFDPAAGGVKPQRSRAHAIAEVVFGCLALAWVLLIPSHPWVLLGPGALYLQALPFQLAPVLWVFFWWIVGLNAVQLTWRTIDLARGSWQKPHPAQHVVFKAIGLAALNLLLFAPGGALVLLKHPEVNQARYGATAAGWNHGLHIAALVICLIVALQLVWDLGKMALGAYGGRRAR
ncbi:MAG: hypothetical protein ACLGSH_01195 [Acidobacteriota bacterium]